MALCEETPFDIPFAAFELSRIHIFWAQHTAQLLVSLLVLSFHPQAEPKREGHADHVTACGRNQARHISRRVLRAKRRCRQYTTQVAQADEQTSVGRAGILVQVVVIVPRMNQTARNICARRHEKAREVGNTAMREAVDSSEDYKTDEGQHKRENNMVRPLAMFV